LRFHPCCRGLQCEEYIRATHVTAIPSRFFSVRSG
jgi:hypothetical protein